MAVCDSNSGWTITMSPDKNPALFEIIFLRLKVTAEGVITGDMFYPPSSTTPFSSVSGTCQPLTRPDGNIMTLSFNWGVVDIFMVGFTHPEASFNRFKGRFIALRRIVNTTQNFDPEMVALIPDPGDTGTGGGSQT